jgi:protein-S-isoprenylcysteine O-methyltransferase Ste14
VSTTFLRTHHAAAALLLATLVGIAAAEGIATAYTRLTTGTVVGHAGAVGDRGTRWALAGSLSLGFALAILAARRMVGPRLPGYGWPAFVLGVVLIWAGGALRVSAVLLLGRFFRRVVAIQEGHHVVRRGPYRLIRHPAYAGDLLIAIGVGLALGYVVSLVILIVLPILGHLPRIRVEEAALERALGDEYRGYERETWRLVPHVW